MAGFTAAWYGGAVLSLIAVVVAVGIKDVESRSASTAGRAKLIHWKAVPPALGFFASVVAMGAFFAFGSLQADAVGLMPVSTPLFVYGLVVVAGRLLLARVLDRFPALLLGAVALAIIGGGLLIMALWSTPIGMTLERRHGLRGHTQYASAISRSSRPQSRASGAPPRAPPVCSSTWG